VGAWQVAELADQIEVMLRQKGVPAAILVRVEVGASELARLVEAIDALV
jgi:hypothetical protein